MTSNSQGPESPVIPAILERYQAEGNNDQEYSLLMNVPAEEKRCVATERDGADKGFPGRLEEESEKNRLKDVS